MNFGDYTDGFSPSNTPSGLAGTVLPGCSIADDFTRQLGDPQESRLAMALALRDGQSCSAATGSKPGIAGPSASAARETDVLVPKSLWQTNRILLPPEAGQ